MKKNIQKIHRNIFEHIRKRALSYEGKPSAELSRYRNDHKKNSERRFKKSDTSELLKSISKSHVIYLGDFHTFDQNQRTLLRIIRSLLKGKKKFKLGLEMISNSKQYEIDAYLNNFLTELEFLESVEYHESWRFPWSHYKILFDTAIENKLEVIGLNSVGNLKSRDKFASSIIKDELEKDPNTPILVLFGELHIDRDKIPMKVKDLVDIKSFSNTIIHQNLDEVYWKLKDPQKKGKVVRFNKNEYCITTSPPWLKYESMAYWYENLLDDPDFDIHEYIIENGLKIFGSNYQDNFHLISNEIIENLNLDIPKDLLDDFNLYDHSQLEYIESKIEKIEKNNIEIFYQYLVENTHSFKLPSSNSYYCSNYSLTRLSNIAGLHIFHCFLKKNFISATDAFNKGPNSRFALMTLEQMFSYFFSKIFNPHRKCDMYIDLKYQLENSKFSQLDKHGVKKTIEILDKPKEIKSILKGQRIHHHHLISKRFGKILGELLYEKVAYEQKKDFDNIFNQVNLSFNSFEKFVLDLLKNKRYKMKRKRFF
jgi:hypothetical protein